MGTVAEWSWDSVKSFRIVAFAFEMAVSHAAAYAFWE